MRRLASLLLIFGVLGAGTATAVVPATPQWQVPAPALLVSHGPPTVPHTWPDCHVSDLRGSAHTLRTTYGVLGVVTLRGRHCFVRVENRLVALLDANSHALTLPIHGAAAADQGRNTIRGRTIALSWGFAWRGTWCGAQAIYVRVELRGGHLMRIPLPGGKPSCPKNPKNARKPVVIRGSFGLPGDPVQTAPLEWSSLSAKLHVDPTLPGSTLHGLTVTLKNSASQEVTLDPCPNYTVMVATKHAAQSVGGTLAGCPGTPTVVPAGRSLTIDLADSPFDRKDFGPTSTKVTLTFGMAGLVPSAVQSRLV